MTSVSGWLTLSAVQTENAGHDSGFVYGKSVPQTDLKVVYFEKSIPVF